MCVWIVFRLVVIRLIKFNLLDYLLVSLLFNYFRNICSGAGTSVDLPRHINIFDNHKQSKERVAYAFHLGLFTSNGISFFICSILKKSTLNRLSAVCDAVGTAPDLTG